MGQGGLAWRAGPWHAWVVLTWSHTSLSLPSDWRATRLLVQRAVPPLSTHFSITAARSLTACRRLPTCICHTWLLQRRQHRSWAARLGVTIVMTGRKSHRTRGCHCVLQPLIGEMFRGASNQALTPLRTCLRSYRSKVLFSCVAMQVQ